MYEIDFLRAGDGNADAICFRYGDDQRGYWLHVVDGGFKDTADLMIAHIGEHYGKNYKISNMVLSHADNDHATGLIGVLNHFDVNGAIYMNRPWHFARQILPAYPGYTEGRLVREIKDKHEYLVQIEEIAAKKNIEVRDVFQGTNIGPFTVLAPFRDRYIRTIPDFGKTPEPKHRLQTAAKTIFGEAVEAVAKWISEDWDIETLSDDPDPPTSASNESSVVQLGQVEGKTLLLTGDVGPIGLNEAADYAQALGLLAPPNFVQVPHHGSRKNVTPEVLNRWLGGIAQKGTKRGTAYCSVGKLKTDYPRGQVQNAFERRGYPVHATRDGTKTHFHGRELRPGWLVSTPEPWASKIEA
ncbi:beta-lactamase superfamily II metal-dependent hydrolase [Bradyrhizobium sp. USDA 3686]|uniref:MBL fold metallo-hydrolase n=1 Tax=Bradyrhizobium canariense TaxID=255045 RepID=UPI0019562286|nr:MBL fold metallo-hydrolase [Bradyrhizobium canariense]MBM7488097.1 beta-lactamase superfamily II metal-dependent hydrolase [Bradyrhizobium canariense]